MVVIKLHAALLHLISLVFLAVTLGHALACAL
jgi:hypothetical protein